MSELTVCRVCLDVNSRMYVIANTDLQEIWEILTNIKLNDEDNKDTSACYICYAYLKRCDDLRRRALKTQMLLTDLCHSGGQLSQESIASIDRTLYKLNYNYNITSTNFGEYFENDFKPINSVKLEIFDVPTDVKEENEDLLDVYFNKETSDFENNVLGTDSEDNIPLTNISVKKKTIKRNKKKRKPIKIILKRIDKGQSLDVTEVVLTKEEQIEQMLNRRKSRNYIFCPFKCDLCFKGFVDDKAFQNHEEKHSESSGAYECSLCHMRYKTERHLKSHCYNVHERQYKCNKCTFISHTPNQAKEHNRWHEGHTYDCKLCDQKFRKPTSYLSHMRTRHPAGNSCNLCGESFVGRFGLMLHKAKMHKVFKDKNTANADLNSQPAEDCYCIECDTQFLSLDAWRRHIMTSMGHSHGNDSSVPSKCQVCKQTVSGVSLKTHLRGHEPKTLKSQFPRQGKNTDELAFECDQCGSKYANGSKLLAHVNRVHLGIKYHKNIVCEVCGKKCTSNAALVYHQRSHTGEKPYACGQCRKRFRDANQLRLHLRTHSGEKPYVCSACEKSFCQKAALNRHLRVHTGVKPYECQYCSKAFSQSNSLKGHVRTVHLKIAPNRKKEPKNEPLEIAKEEQPETLMLQE